MNKTLLCIAFVFLLMRLNAQNKPFVIATDSEIDLIPEGIAVDARTGIIYISSIAKQKIIAIDENGKHRDFISTNQHGFLEGLGMKIDEKRNLLWAISGIRQDKWFTSQVQAFDLTTGKPEHLYTLKDTVEHLLNDLVIDKSGNIYITDMYFGGIYFIDTEKRTLELFLKNSFTQYPNGICMGSAGQLYVATYANGPIRIDIESKELRLLNGYKDSVVAHGMDGLVYSDQSLIGIYNFSKERSGNLVIKYLLNDKGDAIVKEEIIEKSNPHFYEPTTAAISGQYIYVLANSHLAAYNANKQSTKGIESQLKPVTILRYKLD